MAGRTTLVATLLVIVACGSDTLEGQGTTTPIETSVATDAPTVAPSVVSEPVTVQIGGTAYYAGFVIDFVEATFGPSILGVPTVLLRVEVENTNEGTAGPTQFSLDLGGVSVDVVSVGDLANVLAGAPETGDLEFQVPSNFSFDSSTIVVGRDDVAQVRIPFGDGVAVTRLPQTMPVGVVADDGGLTVDVDSATVRWDRVGDNSQIDAGMAYVVIAFDLTTGRVRSTTAGRNFMLILPNGSSVEADGSFDGAPIQVLEADATAEALTTRFRVPEPFAGTYTFVVSGLLNYGDAAPSVTFTIS